MATKAEVEKLKLELVETKELLAASKKEATEALETVTRQKKSLDEKNAQLDELIVKTEKLEKEADVKPSLDKDVKTELAALSKFLLACYRESDHPGVRGDIQRWRHVLDNLD